MHWDLKTRVVGTRMWGKDEVKPVEKRERLREKWSKHNAVVGLTPEVPQRRRIKKQNKKRKQDCVFVFFYRHCCRDSPVCHACRGRQRTNWLCSLRKTFASHCDRQADHAATRKGRRGRSLYSFSFKVTYLMHKLSKWYQISDAFTSQWQYFLLKLFFVNSFDHLKLILQVDWAFWSFALLMIWQPHAWFSLSVLNPVKKKSD